MSQPIAIGVCSWCLGIPADPAALQEACRGVDIPTVHLALGPVLDLPAAQRSAAIAGLAALTRPGTAFPLRYSATMVGFAGEDYSNLQSIRATGGLVPDDLFPQRRAHTLAAADLARDLGVKLLTTHAGFIPDATDRAAFDRLHDHICEVATEVAARGVVLCFETGQETAETLAAFLGSLPPNIPVGVNFDPANMLLYGKGDPRAAVGRLAPWLRHVHGKDARTHKPAPADPMAWRGDEVPLGTGDANLPAVVAELRKHGYQGTIAIEREAGADQRADIRRAAEYLRSL
jgi:sugar phosphate isomerase/epimerase